MTPHSSISVRRAGLDDLDALAPLFDAYRRFYEQPADLPRARAWLHARLAHAEAVVFVAIDEATDPEGAHGPAGFCLLYPTFCSVAAAPVFTLSDLFVAEHARRAGTGRALMLAAQAYARESGAARVDLETARSNARAQALYESLGWQRDDVYLTYNLAP